MRLLLVLITGIAIGFALGHLTADPSPITSEIAAPIAVAPKTTREQTPQTKESRTVLSADTDTDTEDALRQRIAELEARLAAALRNAEPRLASNRLRASRKLRDAILSQALRYRSFYFDLCDFIAVPSLIAEHPVEFAECLERFVLATNAHRGRRIDPEWDVRAVDLESGQKAQLRYLRFTPRKGSRSDGVKVELTLPGSLPTGHVQHYEYTLYASFAKDGSLSSISLDRENSPKAAIKMSLMRLDDGRLSYYMPDAARSLRRTQPELERIFAQLGACARRLANLDDT